MKSEKELLYLLKLRGSTFVKTHITFARTQQSACKKDFERFLGATENDKKFHEWINKLIEHKVLIFHNTGEREVAYYVVNTTALDKLLKQNPEYYVIEHYRESTALVPIFTN